MFKFNSKKITAVCLIVSAVLIFNFPFYCLAGQNTGVTAKAALVIDAKTKKVIYKKNPDLRLPAASTVKILAALIVFERIQLDAKVRISERAAGITPTKVNLTQGAYYKAEDLLKAFLMNSANDAGVALAEAVAGTEFKFAQLMNIRARELSAKNSFFLNATGLPETNKKQYSTPHDLAMFMGEFLKHKKLIEIIKTKEGVIVGSDGKEINLRNHNKMLWRNDCGLVGKTGFTRKAKHCFLGFYIKSGRKFIVSMQGSRKIWDDLTDLAR
ncbi:MAG: serine hydrolase [Candidatus Omnitrophota bacterium]